METSVKKSYILTWPNAVTCLRIVFLYGLVLLINTNRFWLRLVAAAVSILLIIMDWLDGYLAKRLDQKTKLGSLLDIAGDRIVEVVLWICLADLSLVPLWIPILVISRGTLTDTIRGYMVQFGYSGFDENTMMHSSIGRFLTSTPVMRTGYAVMKAVSFSVLLLFSAFAMRPVISADFIKSSLSFGYWLSVCTAIICLIRGIPVIVEGILIIRKEDGKK
jgi:CDP-diacylglycerol--glycerol-3-phosphate 3-phosphatidyltransferase